MRRIMYAGTSLYTGDKIAEALMEYARALAQRNTSDTVFIPARTASGEVGSVEILVGPASQVVSEPVEFEGLEIEDAATVAELERLTAATAPHQPVTEPSSGGLASGLDDLA